MKAFELKNYGKPLAEMNKTVPMEVQQRMHDTSFKISKKHMGFFKRLKMARIMRKERKRFLYVNLFEVKEKGLKDDRFIMTVVRKAAYFSALSKVVGMEKALEIDKELAYATSLEGLSHMLPSAEDLLKCDDPFAALKEWIIEYWKANKGAKIFEYEIAEDSENVLHINCLYCAFDKISELVEEKESALSVCHWDDLLFSTWDKELGIKYTRTKALAKGDTCCDFRFEKVNG
ncbi:MAG: hypothetical protein GTO45_06915 [Candidatus Aminicenantes bacterium]|nr:hypothetical protein [Candidatus Aminicenantes bacterium]NIM78571.1 hypothetical protein [Candidatus Aminicenantes bacterium]NIN17817.1 hypothetical protein [Candidatus Aminicenantes bacterium]NIN41721.1 hypothetical protein [Candidatus Aminicenantes bacterium]NIN84470.1 hypothetical protein [Candidatus Aminicenantes bacterium]